MGALLWKKRATLATIITKTCSFLEKQKLRCWWWHQTKVLRPVFPGLNCVVPPDHLRRSHSRALATSKSHILYISHSAFTAWNVSLVACPHCCAAACSLKPTLAKCKIFLEGTLATVKPVNELKRYIRSSPNRCSKTTSLIRMNLQPPLEVFKLFLVSSRQLRVYKPRKALWMLHIA